MNQEQAFLDSISKNSCDQHLRLVYADWLEEEGRPEAENIRKEAGIVKKLTRGGSSYIEMLAVFNYLTQCFLNICNNTQAARVDKLFSNYSEVDEILNPISPRFIDNLDVKNDPKKIESYPRNALKFFKSKTFKELCSKLDLKSPENIHKGEIGYNSRIRRKAELIAKNDAALEIAVQIMQADAPRIVKDHLETAGIEISDAPKAVKKYLQNWNININKQQHYR